MMTLMTELGLKYNHDPVQKKLRERESLHEVSQNFGTLIHPRDKKFFEDAQIFSSDKIVQNIIKLSFHILDFTFKIF